jgi:nucleoside-diphosphate-sugar epimerase
VDVAIAGGHGKIGLRLGRLLAERGDRARGLIRKPEQRDDLTAVGVEPVVCDLEADDDVGAAIDGADAVVFAAGAGAGSGPERKWTMDYGGAAKLVAAAEAKGVPRYVMVSSMGAGDPPSGDDPFSIYLQAKAKADRELQDSGLDWTISRPGRLTDDPGTGRIEAGLSVHRGQIPRDDVAATLLAVLDHANTVGVVFEEVAGETPIEEGVADLRATARE